MYKILLAEETQQYINEMVAYCQDEELGSKSLVKRLKEILYCFEQLEFFPEMFPYHHHLQLKRQGYRKAITKHYIILYSVDSTEETVYIRGIFNGHTNYESYFL